MMVAGVKIDTCGCGGQHLRVCAASLVQALAFAAASMSIRHPSTMLS